MVIDFVAFRRSHLSGYPRRLQSLHRPPEPLPFMYWACRCYVLVGDGINGITWYPGFARPMETIAKRLAEARHYGLAIDWHRVLKGLTGVEAIDHHWDVRKPAHDLFAALEETRLEQESWTGETSESSGTYSRAYVVKTRYRSTLRKLNCIVNRLDRHFREAGHVDCIARAERAAEERRQQALVGLSEKERRQSACASPDLVACVWPVLELRSKLEPYLIGDVAYVEDGPILASPGGIYVITSNALLYRRYVESHWQEMADELRGSGIKLIEVKESYPEGELEKRIVDPAKRRSVMGWRQTYSILTGGNACETAQINKVRIRYMRWCDSEGEHSSPSR